MKVECPSKANLRAIRGAKRNFSRHAGEAAAIRVASLRAEGEAIQRGRGIRVRLDCFVACAPRNDGGRLTARQFRARACVRH